MTGRSPSTHNGTRPEGITGAKTLSAKGSLKREAATEPDGAPLDRDLVLHEPLPHARNAVGVGRLAQPSTGEYLQPSPALPIPALVDTARGSDVRCVVTPVDRDGRLADRSVLAFMGWLAGQAVTFVNEPGLIVIARTGGSGRVDRRGHLRLPLAVRRRCGIVTGDRVLVAANRQRNELLVIPMAAVDAMVVLYREPGDSQARR
ncbi:hypothetical protein ACLQ2S_25735 [Micromonospora sp. DT48]|uniref:hypothetical protein n=1 Tax=Micromonospora sp. DT48 TaxID=3393429 RepID=UPI003CF545E3